MQIRSIQAGQRRQVRVLNLMVRAEELLRTRPDLTQAQIAKILGVGLGWIENFCPLLELDNRPRGRKRDKHSESQIIQLLKERPDLTHKQIAQMTGRSASKVGTLAFENGLQRAWGRKKGISPWKKVSGDGSIRKDDHHSVCPVAETSPESDTLDCKQSGR